MLLPAKCNLVPDVTGLAYGIESDAEGRPIVVWSADPVQMTADDAFEAQEDEEAPARTEAEDWLIAHLAEGPQPAGDIKRAARKDGFTEKPLQRARERVCEKSYKSAFHGAWVWELKAEPAGEVDPEDDRPPMKMTRHRIRASSGTLGATGTVRGRPS